jgi:deoxyribodipyrimidine photo-lyase
MVIHWFRQDLRLKDNPSLCAAIEAGEVLLIYIWDTKNNEFPLGAASRWWLHHALIELNKNLQGHLNIYLGDPVEILCNLLEEKNIQGVFWNRCYEPWQIRRDTVIKEKISARGVSVSTFQSGLLWEPWTVSKSDGTPYKVFTPYYFGGCLIASEPRQPFSAPALNSIASQTDADAVSLDSLELLSHGKWETQLLTHWQIGEHAAQEKLHLFVDSGLQDYKSCRDFPAIQSTSQLSPYLLLVKYHLIKFGIQYARKAMMKTPHIFCENWRGENFHITSYIIFLSYLSKIGNQNLTSFPGRTTWLYSKPGN